MSPSFEQTTTILICLLYRYVYIYTKVRKFQFTTIRWKCTQIFFLENSSKNIQSFCNLRIYKKNLYIFLGCCAFCRMHLRQTCGRQCMCKLISIKNFATSTIRIAGKWLQNGLLLFSDLLLKLYVALRCL